MRWGTCGWTCPRAMCPETQILSPVESHRDLGEGVGCFEIEPLFGGGGSGPVIVMGIPLPPPRPK